jgi:hypothetical protein
MSLIGEMLAHRSLVANLWPFSGKVFDFDCRLCCDLGENHHSSSTYLTENSAATTNPRNPLDRDI